MSTCKTLLRACPKSSRSSLLPLTHHRHESSTRRHKKLLNLSDAPSYTPSTRTPTLIFNPPSSAPSVYHTPLKFLPQTDRRRQLYSAALTSTTQTALRTRTPSIAHSGTPLSTPSFLPPKPSTPLPAPVREPYEKKYHLTEKDMEEIRKLRTEDPDTWTRVRLAEKFGCSQFFVGMIVKNTEKAERVREEHEKMRERWGPRRRMAREDRGQRRERWGREV
ncbi:mitochondrial ribosomal protein subunit L20-domain-containing protein [Clohesyomyces aquaticus]|uniref:Mitochondrial ribosomal protein subunit L20-domain-containing protein n=1 Tax=Clohesyomyces aquaticus TaxID=1231657 RepID=A0A1Y1ZXI0_9PLEO|nr:mitochondrial ribosomal protein subunit L20-domain-containing protein [Clohesyomyces aquaticus]